MPRVGSMTPPEDLLRARSAVRRARRTLVNVICIRVCDFGDLVAYRRYITLNSRIRFAHHIRAATRSAVVGPYSLRGANWSTTFVARSVFHVAYMLELCRFDPIAGASRTANGL